MKIIVKVKDDNKKKEYEYLTNDKGFGLFVKEYKGCYLEMYQIRGTEEKWNKRKLINYLKKNKKIKYNRQEKIYIKI